MAEQWNLKVGDKIVLTDGLDSWRRTYEGEVIACTEVAGTDIKRIVMDPPFRIERLREE